MTRSMKDRMLAGEHYLADDPELIEMLTTSQGHMDRYNATTSSDQAAQRAILAEWLGSVGEADSIRPPLRVDYGTNLHVGDRDFHNYGLFGLDRSEHTTGDGRPFGTNRPIRTSTRQR